MDRLLPYLEAHLIKDVAKLTISYICHNPLTPYEVGFYGIEEMLPTILVNDEGDYGMCTLGAAESNSSRLMIDIGLTWDQCDDTTLEGACRGNNEELIEEMLLMGADTSYGLRGACYGGHQSLIDRFSKLTNDYSEGLIGACLAGRKDVALNMINLGALPSTAINRTLENKEMSKWLMDEYKVKPTNIGEIVRHGYIEFIAPDIGYRSKRKAIVAAFMYDQTVAAFMYDQIEIAVKLIGMGASIDKTCINYAFRNRNPRLIELLPSNENRNKIELKWACRHNDIRRVMELIEMKESSGIIMEEACNTNNITLARIALEHGSIPMDIRIEHAGLYDNIELLELIPEEILKDQMDEVFRLACIMNNRQAIDFLLGRGADPNIGIHEAYNLNNKDLLQHLLSRGAKPSSVFGLPSDSTSIGDLIYREDLLNYLFDAGLHPDYLSTMMSDINYKDHVTRFIDLAVKRGANIDMILYECWATGLSVIDLEYLLSNGADPYCLLDNDDLVLDNRELLIKYGISPQHIDSLMDIYDSKYYKTLIEMGIHPDRFIRAALGNMEMAEYLLAKGASPRLYKAFTPFLLIALKNGIISPNYAVCVASANAKKEDKMYQDVIDEARKRGATNIDWYTDDD